MQKIFAYEPSEIKSLLKEVILEIEEEKKAVQVEQLLTINEVAKKLRRSHVFTHKLVKTGQLKTTPDKRIPVSEVERYLSLQ